MCCQHEPMKLELEKDGWIDRVCIEGAGVSMHPQLEYNIVAWMAVILELVKDSQIDRVCIEGASSQCLNAPPVGI